ncbi:beta-glucosidase 40-like [Silene latifolia]|uniref:beta-glucosidase 40-like n=1 Tax=Silene latifolia TaxID=37657 RepID=UPI003D76A6CA
MFHNTNKHIFGLFSVLLLFVISMVMEDRDYNLGFAMAVDDFNRGSFPHGFVFGTASSAYQYEGAVKEDGRGPCVWDKYTHSFGKVLDFSNADVAEDHYHRYLEDIGLMKDMGMDSYRFSISWTRIFPNGTGQINQAGVDFYNNLINALLAKGIEPYVTIFHWDTPQALEDRYNGWLSPQIINDFGFYAGTLFEKFGDRVKHWITLNEPHNFAINGYDLGIAAPGRCSILLHLFCRAGNSVTEPYIVAHNLILSHATAAQIYRQKYKAKQGGSIGAAFDVIWYEPDTNTTKNVEATQRAMDFQLGWFLDPIMFGDYPSSMKERVGNRLPKFSQADSNLVKGSLDFVGINHYTTYYAKDSKINLIGMVLKDAQSDSGSTTSPIGHDLKPIGDKANSIWLYIVPGGMRRLMNYIKTKYGNPTVVITENGMDDPNIPLMPRSLILKDNKRIQYHHDYLQNLAAAINEDGCNVKGYFAWSLLDNWEWAAGYSSRFGLHYVDHNDNLKRYPKNSALWFKSFLTSSTY